MDLWFLIQQRLGVRTLSFAYIGRWAGHLLRGRFAHAAIAQAPPIQGELAWGWLTHYAVGVPGTVAGMEHALKRWGTLPLSKVVAPAAALADKGFPVSETLAKILQQEQKNMGRWPATQAIFWKNGAPLQRGGIG